MRHAIALALLTLSMTSALAADVSIIERRATRSSIQPGKDKPEHGRHGSSKATGSATLIDSGGFQYFINTDITFSTSSSASAAMSEASYAGPVNATTSGGGLTSSTLNDAFDGYNSLCVSLNNTLGSCSTGNPNFAIYNQTGAAPTTECSGRQYVFPTQTVGGINVSRKVFVPLNDQFARWLNIFTNTTGSPITFTMDTGNNLGSDSNTVIVNSSSGNAAAELTDTWVSTFQNYSGTTSSDPRLGHVLQGAGASVPLSGINFVNGDDNPWWGYTITLQPGETKIIANFVTGQPSKAAANAKAAEIAALPPNAVQCLSGAERNQISNFVAQQNVVEVPTLGALGLAVLAIALTAMAVVLLRRRRADVRSCPEAPLRSAPRERRESARP
jgi:hypothetical protein